MKSRSSAIAQTTQAREQQPVQQQPSWGIPSTWSWGTIAPIVGSLGALGAWLIYDRGIKPRLYSWISRLKRPYADIEEIANGLQTIRGETGAERAIVMEVDCKRGTMIALAQEVDDAGTSKIVFSDRDNQADCVKKILQRFNDDSFVVRETDKITGAEQYQGFLSYYGIGYAIYYKVGENGSTAWILALHFSNLAHVDYLTAVDLRYRIEQVGSSMFYLLLQRSPVEGLIK